eukprot:TRINITY_DN9406_c0_g1_i2.p1 TRINITY_DN9406_c0_g1~~TRINITY_DN9406_c0_g1_i2.p1  ORF type:complete len:113 (+),score=51.24 TRINITY_DN9406_c0_g1_i2:2-340(+)
MITNAKQLEDRFMNKKEHVEMLVEAVEGLRKLTKQSEQVAVIKNLEYDVTFLKGFAPKFEHVKIILNCLRNAAEKKKSKLEGYEDEIMKYTNMIQVATVKTTEYEQKLNYYY